jgi:hypothetical protein
MKLLEEQEEAESSVALTGSRAELRLSRYGNGTDEERERRVRLSDSVCFVSSATETQKEEARISSSSSKWDC